MTETQGWFAMGLFALWAADYFWMRDYTYAAWRWTVVFAAVIVLEAVSLR